MSRVVDLIIDGPDDAMPGFTHFWGKWVTGFNQRFHCMKCLRGPRVSQIKPGMRPGVYELKPPENLAVDYLYICGVAEPGCYVNNFHMAVNLIDGVDWVKADTWNGFRVWLGGCTPVAIPCLPFGFAGLPSAFTNCRNFQFGVAKYGYDATVREGPFKPGSLLHDQS